MNRRTESRSYGEAGYAARVRVHAVDSLPVLRPVGVRLHAAALEL